MSLSDIHVCPKCGVVLGSRNSNSEGCNRHSPMEPWLIIKPERLLTAAREVDDAWDAWMMNEEDVGQDRMEQAIAGLREALRGGRPRR